MPVFASNKTIKEVVFSGQQDFTNSVLQLNTDKTIQRTLVPIVTPKKNFYKYYLVENDILSNSYTETYVISKAPITQQEDLFKIAIAKEGVTAYKNDLTAKQNNQSHKLLLKYNGKELDLNSTVAETISPDNGPVLNSAVAPGEGGVICVDHWWVEYDEETGEILSIDYLGSDCYVVGSGGGGGSQGINCAQTLAAFTNQGSAVSEKTGEVDIYNTGAEWKKQYMWKIFQAGLYIVTSTEEATLEKKPYKSNIGQTLYRWEFMSFVHKNTNAIGASAGCTREVKDVTGTSNITPTRLTASMELTFTIETKVLGAGGACSIEQTYTQSCLWAAPNNNVVIVAQ